MIPYRPEPVFRAGGIEIHAFGLFLTAGVLLGGYIMIQRARRKGMGGHVMFDVSVWAIVFALIGADVAKLAMDYHALFAAHPGIVFTTSAGLRSIGGLAGGFVGAAIRCRMLRLPFGESVRILDIMAYSMPFAFAVGRFGCFLAHDHRGLASASWIAVRFPEGPRYDLGFVEFAFLARFRRSSCGSTATITGPDFFWGCGSHRTGCSDFGWTLCTSSRCVSGKERRCFQAGAPCSSQEKLLVERAAPILYHCSA